MPSLRQNLGLDGRREWLEVTGKARSGSEGTARCLGNLIQQGRPSHRPSGTQKRHAVDVVKFSGQGISWIPNRLSLKLHPPRGPIGPILSPPSSHASHHVSPRINRKASFWSFASSKVLLSKTAQRLPPGVVGKETLQDIILPVASEVLLEVGGIASDTGSMQCCVSVNEPSE